MEVSYHCIHIDTAVIVTDQFVFFFSSRRRHTTSLRDWSSDVCSSDLELMTARGGILEQTIGGSGTAPRAVRRNWVRPAGRKGALMQITKSFGILGLGLMRSEERRVGKEWGHGWMDAGCRRRAGTGRGS